MNVAILYNNERLELKAENKKIKSTENQYIKTHRKTINPLPKKTKQKQRQIIYNVNEYRKLKTSRTKPAKIRKGNTSDPEVDTIRILLMVRCTPYTIM